MLKESFPAHWDKEPFVGTPTLREISLLLLTPFPPLPATRTEAEAWALPRANI